MSSAKKKNSGRLKASDPTVLIARELSAIAEAHGVAELIYKTADLKLTIRRGEAISAATAAAVGQMMPPMPTLPVAGQAPLMNVQASPPPQHAEAPPAPEPAAGHEVTSPFVGTFYRSPNPDASAYVEIGQRVEKGQVLCIVEAMKLMNEIEADVSGTVTAILVHNAEPVEYGQPLFRLDPA
jgi:acetyl-CoA carboxylase biotin carboxyl carrier protein